MEESKKPVNFDLKAFLLGNEPKTFLVGAGCSVDPPSCLPDGRTMMEAILQYICAESEVEKILKLKNLRFEALMEILRNHLDRNLKLIDFYTQCDKPNFQHFFLAEMIKRGHFLMTTNFDFLIEQALLQSDVPRKEILPVITRDNFENYSDPLQLFTQGKKTVYKINGSTKNLITNEDTQASLIATIQAFGSNKEEFNIFQIEPFKRPLFNNISNKRSLVVLGYSGSDDFDVVPTLKVLKNLRAIFWIQYKKEEEEITEVYEISLPQGDIKAFDKIDQVLTDFKQINPTVRVYRVELNTTRLLKDLFNFEYKINTDSFSVDLGVWLRNNITKPTSFKKFQIPYEIYSLFNKYDDAMRCCEAILHLYEEARWKSLALHWKAKALNNIGVIYCHQGYYIKALPLYEEVLQVYQQLGLLTSEAITHSNIGIIYLKQGKYMEAHIKFELALIVHQKLDDLAGQAGDLNNIGSVYHYQGKFSEALQQYEAALKIHQQLGNLAGQTIQLSNIGMIYHHQGKYNEAMQRIKEALKIDHQLGSFAGEAIDLNNIGSIYLVQGKYPEALQRFEAALKINQQLGNHAEEADVLSNIGEINRVQGKYPEALQRFNMALKILSDIGLDDSPIALKIRKNRAEVSTDAKTLRPDNANG